MTPVKAINHIGIAVRSIEGRSGRTTQGTLGAVFEGVEEVADQKGARCLLPRRRRAPRTTS